jgi:hypothetical protein
MLFVVRTKVKPRAWNWLSHNLTVPSWLAVANKLPSGENATAGTTLECVSSVNSSSLRATRQR